MSEQLVRSKLRKQRPKSSTTTGSTLSGMAVNTNPGINVLPAFQNLQVA